MLATQTISTQDSLSRKKSRSTSIPLETEEGNCFKTPYSIILLYSGPKKTAEDKTKQCDRPHPSPPPSHPASCCS